MQQCVWDSSLRVCRINAWKCVNSISMDLVCGLAQFESWACITRFSNLICTFSDDPLKLFQCLSTCQLNSLLTQFYLLKIDIFFIYIKELYSNRLCHLYPPKPTQIEVVWSWCEFPSMIKCNHLYCTLESFLYSPTSYSDYFSHILGLF